MYTGIKLILSINASIGIDKKESTILHVTPDDGYDIFHL